MSQERYILSALILLLSIAGLGVWLMWLLKHRNLWPLSIGPLIWLVVMVAFYGYLVFVDSAATELTATISASLRLYEVILVLVGGWVFFGDRKGTRP